VATKNRLNWLRVTREAFSWLFVILFLVCVVVGIVIQQLPETRTSHFKDIVYLTKDGKFDPNNQPSIQVHGQYKTEAPDFIVGEPIHIDILILTSDQSIFEELKRFCFRGVAPLFVKNSEAPEQANRDISRSLKQFELESAFVNEGTLEPTISDSNRSVYFSGDIIFTNVGDLEFGEPLWSWFKKYDLRLTGIEISPRHVITQIGIAKRAEFLSILSLGMGFLSLGLALRTTRNQRKQP
jgi:hypothetical protein